jgi:nucleolar protein 15
MASSVKKSTTKKTGKKTAPSTRTKRPVAVVKADEENTTSKQTQKTPTVVPGGAVVYVGRVPHGFYEEEMRDYFGQFGEITRLRLSRNRTSGASKHYAFIEFKHANVAEVVVETMHNYLLFNQLLQCKLVPSEQVHSECFKGANLKFKVIPWRAINRKRHNAERSAEELAKIVAKGQERKAALKEKLAKSGIKYDLSEVITQ